MTTEKRLLDLLIRRLFAFRTFHRVCGRSWFKKGGGGEAEDTSIFKEMDVVNVFISLVERKRLKIQQRRDH